MFIGRSACRDADLGITGHLSMEITTVYFYSNNTLMFHVFRFWTLFRLGNRVAFFVASITDLCTVIYYTRRKDIVMKAGFKCWHARRMIYPRSYDFGFVFHGKKPRWQHVTLMAGCVVWERCTVPVSSCICSLQWETILLCIHLYLLHKNVYLKIYRS